MTGRPNRHRRPRSRPAPWTRPPGRWRRPRPLRRSIRPARPPDAGVVSPRRTGAWLHARRYPTRAPAGVLPTGASALSGATPVVRRRRNVTWPLTDEERLLGATAREFAEREVA